MQCVSLYGPIIHSRSSARCCLLPGVVTAAGQRRRHVKTARHGPRHSLPRTVTCYLPARSSSLSVRRQSIISRYRSVVWAVVGSRAGRRRRRRCFQTPTQMPLHWRRLHGPFARPLRGYTLRREIQRNNHLDTDTTFTYSGRVTDWVSQFWRNKVSAPPSDFLQK